MPLSSPLLWLSSLPLRFHLPPQPAPSTFLILPTQVYPTRQFLSLYLTSAPRNNTIAVTLAILGCAVLFIVYDVLSRNIVRDLSNEAALQAAKAKAELALVRGPLGGESGAKGALLRSCLYGWLLGAVCKRRSCMRPQSRAAYSFCAHTFASSLSSRSPAALPPLNDSRRRRCAPSQPTPSGRGNS